MLYSFPNYYKEFTCVADKCEDTCCAGWQIVIDPLSLKKYHNLKGPFKSRVFRSIDWRQGTFRQDEDRRCAFLNEQNLCDLYTNAGEDSLCKTCRNYPRHIEEFENVREITLSLSCPEVASIFLRQTKPVTFLQYEDAKEEEYEDFDLFLYSELVEAREQMLSVLQDRDMKPALRGALVYAISHDMQRRINRQELFSCNEVYDKYKSQKAKVFVNNHLDEFLNDYSVRYNMMRQLMEDFLALEPLKKDWTALMIQSRELLYGQGVRHYAEIIHKFDAWVCHLPMWDIWTEQLLVYFLSTYFCGAAYDGEVFSKAQMGLTSLALIHEICLARWVINEETFDEEDMKEIIYRFSREVEHSDPNLNALEKIRFFIK